MFEKRIRKEDNDFDIIEIPAIMMHWIIWNTDWNTNAKNIIFLLLFV
jgi:hypothetical protein